MKTIKNKNKSVMSTNQKRDLARLLIILLILFLIICIPFLWTHFSSRSIRDKMSSEGIDSDILSMKSTVFTLADAMDQEISLFEGVVYPEDYEAFIDGLDMNFDEIETQYASYHRDVLEKIEDLEADEKNGSARQEIQEVSDYVEDMTSVLTDLFNYHYMVLGAKTYFMDFNQQVDEMTAYMDDGNVTTTTYNNDLQELMDGYTDLLNLNSVDLLDQAYLDNEDDMQSIIDRLDDLLPEIDSLDTQTDQDEFINEKMYYMFYDVREAVNTTLEYAQKQDEDAQMPISDISSLGANGYCQERMGALSNPFTAWSEDEK